jgi:hypothetical protein
MEAVTSAVVMVGIVVGFVVGVGFALARRAWSDYRKTTALASGMRKTAWSLTGSAAGRFALAGVLLVVVVLYAMARGG